MAKPSRDDVAHLAQVSGATVSRVLSGRLDVSVDANTRARVLKAAADLGYVPNAAARGLAKGETGLISLWLHLGYSRYRSQVVDAMHQLLYHTDYALVVTDVEDETFWPRALARALRIPSDGVIAFDVPTAGEMFLATTKGAEHPTPFVSMGAFWSSTTTCVGVDLKAGTMAAMDHLLSIGKKRIAYIYPLTYDAKLSEPRSKAYLEAMTAAGLEPTLIQSRENSFTGAYRRIQEHFRSHQPPDAIFCYNDDLALGVSQAVQDLGLAVGTKIAIIGCDGIAETNQVRVPITTVRQPVDEMCNIAWQFLQEQMRDPLAPRREKMLTPELVIRKSTTG
jgi:DNA-binding LacI/PurR family transcriptional regulator